MAVRIAFISLRLVTCPEVVTMRRLDRQQGTNRLLRLAETAAPPEGKQRKRHCEGDDAQHKARHRGLRIVVDHEGGSSHWSNAARTAAGGPSWMRLLTMRSVSSVI